MENKEKTSRLLVRGFGIIDAVLLVSFIILLVGKTSNGVDVRPALEKNFVESKSEKTDITKESINVKNIKLGETRKEEVKEEVRGDNQRRIEEKVEVEAQKHSEYNAQQEGSKTEEVKNNSSNNEQAKINNNSTNKEQVDVNNNLAEDKYKGFLFPDSNKRVLSYDELSKVLTTEEKYQQAVNELYARHGYDFQYKEIRAFFDKYSWYRSMNKKDMQTVAKSLSKIELDNFMKLMEFGKDKGFR